MDFLTNSVILVNLCLFLFILVHFKQSWPILVHIGTLGLFLSLFVHLGAFWAIFIHISPYYWSILVSLFFLFYRFQTNSSEFCQFLYHIVLRCNPCPKMSNWPTVTSQRREENRVCNLQVTLNSRWKILGVSRFGFHEWWSARYYQISQTLPLCSYLYMAKSCRKNFSFPPQKGVVLLISVYHPFSDMLNASWVPTSHRKTLCTSFLTTLKLVREDQRKGEVVWMCVHSTTSDNFFAKK